MPTFLEDNPRKFAQEIAEKSDCKMKTVRDLNQCLMDMSPLELLEAFMEHGVCQIIKTNNIKLNLLNSFR